MGDVVERVVAASAGRDRVLDAVKAFALIVVVIGHSLAWHVNPAGQPVNVLEVDSRLIVLTWIFQVLPLFFAAGALSNSASVERHSRRDYLAGRTRRLVTPVLVYAGFWSLVLLPLAPVVPLAVGAGVFLAQLLWFAGVYLIVAAAAPWTSRWTTRPWLTLTCWACAILLVDVARTNGAPDAVGWVNLLLVWGFLHQIGYHLPALRTARTGVLVPAAVLAFAAALVLALAGPYSSSLITVGGDTELSNLAPPSVVLALYGVAQILLLAVVWQPIGRGLRRDRVWAWIAIVGSRGMGIYLWHIPLVAIAAGVAMAVGWTAPPLSPMWWTVHLAVVCMVIPAAWFAAGLAHRGERRIDKTSMLFGLPTGTAAVCAGVVILDLSVTGFATWSGAGMLAIPSSTPILVVGLWALWQSASVRSRAPVPSSG